MKTSLFIVAMAVAKLIILTSLASASGGGGTAGSSGGSTWAMGYYGGTSSAGWARGQVAVMKQNVAN